MNHHDFALFLTQFSLMILIAFVCGRVARRMGQPAVFGELLGGILLGPTVFGALAPGVSATLFPSTGGSVMARETIVRMGLLFFLAVAGLETDLGPVRRHKLCFVLVAVLGMGVPFALGYGLVFLAPGLFEQVTAAKPGLMAVFMGTALAVSALPVIARILMELDLLRGEVGAVVMAAAVANDLVGWLLFGLVLANVPGTMQSHATWTTSAVVVGLFVVFLTVGRWAGKRLVGWLRAHGPWPGGFIGMSAFLVLLLAGAFEWLGSHATIGAFLVGAALAPGFAREDPDKETISQFVAGFFAAPVYFVSVGLRTDFLGDFDALLVGLVLLVACVGKVGGAGIGAWLAGMGWRKSLAIGFGLNARGVIQVVLASVALENGIIGQRIFVALVITALVTSILSGPVMKRLIGRPE